MAAPAYKSAGAGASTETSGAAHNLTCPATVDAGDLLIAHLAYEGTTVAPTDPSGWTLLGGSPYFSATMRVWIYGRIADGTEDGATVNFGSPANSNSRHGRIYSFSGARQDISDVVGGFVTVSPTASATVTDADVTTVIAECLAVNLVAVNDDNTGMVSFTGEAGGDWTEAVAEYQTAATTPDWSLQLQVATMNSAGTVGGGSYTMGASDTFTVVGFYIRPPVAGGTAHETNPSDSVTISESVTVAVGRNISPSDSVTVSETVIFERQIVRTDSVTPTDAVALTRENLLADSVNVSDNATPERGISQAADDSVTASDNATTESGKGVTAEDSITVEDALRFDREMVVVDTVSLSDAIVFDRELVVADSFSLVEAIAFQLEITVADVLSLADNITPELTPGGGNAHTVNVDDVVTLSDALNFVREMVLTDSVQIQDSNARQLNGLFLPDGTAIVNTARGAIIIGRF